MGQVGQAAEGLALGTQLLGQSTNEAGQTVQRTVDEAGNIVENTLDESGGILEETPVGSITDLPAEEEYQTEEGQTVGSETFPFSDHEEVRKALEERAA